MRRRHVLVFFFFNDTATTEIYTLSLHDRSSDLHMGLEWHGTTGPYYYRKQRVGGREVSEYLGSGMFAELAADRKSTRLNSSHANISYAVFCLKKKNNKTYTLTRQIWA